MCCVTSLGCCFSACVALGVLFLISGVTVIIRSVIAISEDDEVTKVRARAGSDNSYLAYVYSVNFMSAY